MQAALNARVAEPLQEYYKRRIVVWMDEEGEFADSVQDMVLENARILIMRKDHLFEIRRQIEIDYADENLVIYCPYAFSVPEDNWLMDVFLYSEEFRADYWSLLFSDLHVANTRETREFAHSVADFFKNKERNAKLVALKPKYENEKELRNGVFSVLCGIRSWGIADIVRAVVACEDDDRNPLRNIEKYCGPDMFWTAVEEAYGYTGAYDIDLLTCYLLVSAAMSTADTKAFAGLPGNSAFASQAYAFFWNWQREDRDGLLEAYNRMERNYEIGRKLQQMDRDVLMKLGVFPAADQVLLSGTLRSFAEGHFNIDDTETLMRERTDKPWYEEYQPYYAGIEALKNMYRFYLAHKDGFKYDSPDLTWKNYTEALYQMDQYYRAFCNAFEAALDRGIMRLEDDLKKAAEVAERLYKNWFLFELNGRWSEQLDSVQDLSEILQTVSRQRFFYSNYIRHEDNRSFVIVSDGLRYEVAMQLTDVLNGRLNGNTVCSAEVGTYPTITPVGMAALLPHMSLKLGDDLKITCDGMPTEAPNREAVLKAANEKSVAVGFEAFRQMTRAQRQDLVKPANVIYIYHDVIDKTGEAGGKVLSACDQTISELAQMMKILVNEMSASSVYITADHGFIYTRSPLDEYEKTDKDVVEGEVLEYKRRYAIVRNWKFDARANRLSLKNLGREDLDAVFPRGNYRFRIQGIASPYMHGGLSLQELVIPVVHYQNRKAGQKGYQAIEKAEIELLGDNRKISNNLFSLNFYQKQPCSGKVLPRQVEVYFEDAQGKRISDDHKLTVNSTSEEKNDRRIRVSFRLLESGLDSHTDYFLVMKDAESGEKLIREAFRIEVVFGNEFDF